MGAEAGRSDTGRTSTSRARMAAALVLVALAAGMLVSLRSTASAAVSQDPLCVPKPAAVAPDATRILTIGDSLTSAASGDYTWRYFLWKTLVNPGGQADPAAAAYDFVGPYTKVVDPVNLTRTSDVTTCDFDKDNAAEPGSLLTAYTVATNAGTSTRIQDLVNRPDGRDDDADVLLVFGAVNDLSKTGDGAATADQVITREKTIATKAQLANPAIKIVFVTAPQAAGTPAAGSLGAKIADFNRKLVAQAPTWSKGASTVAVAEAVKNWNTYATTYDLIHPNPQGEVGIAADIADALRGLGIGTGGVRPLPNYGDYIGPRQGAVLAQPTVDSAGAHLSWTLPAGSVQSRVVRKDFTAGSDFKVLGTVAQGYSASAKPPYVGTYLDGSYIPGHTYQYFIVSAKGTNIFPAYVQYATKVASNTVTVPLGATLPPAGTPTTNPTTAPPAKPGNITNFAATPRVHGMKLSWAAATQATGYRVNWRLAENGKSFSRDVGRTELGHLISGLVPGKAYTFKVQALGAQAGNWSSTLTRVPAPYPLTKVARLTLKTVSGHRIRATWAAVSKASRYEVWMRSAGGAWRRVANSSVRTYTSAKLITGKTYQVRVRACDGPAPGPYSATAKVVAK